MTIVAVLMALGLRASDLTPEQNYHISELHCEAVVHVTESSMCVDAVMECLYNDDTYYCLDKNKLDEIVSLNE